MSTKRTYSGQKVLRLAPIPLSGGGGDSPQILAVRGLFARGETTPGADWLTVPEIQLQTGNAPSTIRAMLALAKAAGILEVGSRPNASISGTRPVPTYRLKDKA